MNTEAPKHAHPGVEHAPVVIHHDDDETILERGLRRALAAGPLFWGGVAGAIVLFVALALVLGTFSSGDPKAAESWTELALANDAESQLKVAERFPNTPAARWAKLRAASERYNEAVDKFPTDRESAAALLTKAMELYREVADGPADSPETRAAALGIARVLETRGELDKAIEQCRKVAARWPDTDEAREADRLAKLLDKPSSRKFYEELYAYKPTKPRFPGGGDVPELFKPMLPGGDRLPPVFEEDDKKANPSKDDAKAESSKIKPAADPSAPAEPKADQTASPKTQSKPAETKTKTPTPDR